MANTLPATTDTTAVAPGQTLGDLLLAENLVTTDQIEVALHEKSRSGKLLGAILVELGFITHAQLNEALSRRTGFAPYSPDLIAVDDRVARQLPHDLAERHKILFLGQQPDGLTLGMVDPYDVFALDAARVALVADGPQPLLPMLLTDAQFASLSSAIYGHSFDLPWLLAELRAGPATVLAPHGPTGDQGGHPVVRLVSSLLIEAVRAGASDLHFEPEELFIRIRQRQDGDLIQIATLHRDFWPALSSRLKVIASMNIANRLVPQDGRFSLPVLGRTVDFRVASLPGVHGENIVIRILDKSRAIRSLDTLGFTGRQLRQLRAMAAQAEGLIVLTGPTGSGKTTTLYALLTELASVRTNIMTLEDPVEYQLPLLRQTQVNEQTGLGFANGIRAILRQDPDVLLIGEIRDAETAQMAVRAAMTGHLVFATLHTRDALGAIPRLLDFGLSPALLAGNLLGIATQRLARRLCPQCKVEHDCDAGTASVLKLGSGARLATSAGCPSCRGTGHQGREVVAEVLPFTPALDELLQKAESTTRGHWLSAAQASGFESMADVARDKLLDRKIGLGEYRRLTGFAHG